MLEKLYNNVVRGISFQFTFGKIPLVSLKSAIGFSGGSDGLQCGRPRFNPWVRKIPWRSDWLPTPVFLPGESHRQRSLAGYHFKGRKESDMTEWLTHTHTHTHTHRGKCIPQKLANATNSPSFLSRELIVKHCPAYQHSGLSLSLFPMSFSLILSYLCFTIPPFPLLASYL